MLKEHLKMGHIPSMGYLPELTEKDIDDSEHIVGLMGAEPIQEALRQGAQVVLAGRTSDTAVYSAIPLLRGFAPGKCWHAAKVLECGAASTTATVCGDCILVT
jgi:hypothetical protein